MGKRVRRTIVVLAAVAVLTGAAAVCRVRFERATSEKAGLWSAEVAYPVFAGRSAIEKYASSAFKKEAVDALTEFKGQARKYASKDFGEWELDMKPTVSVVRDRIISGYYEEYAYTGGAHPNTAYKTLNIGLRGGKYARLGFRDLLLPGKDADKFASEVIIPKLNVIKKSREADPVESLDEGLIDSFVVTLSGITWIFQPYAVGSYAEGTYMVKVPWSEMQAWLNEKGVLKGLVGGKG